MQIEFASQTLRLHPAGALFWPGEGLLIASDLHLEKGSHQATRRRYFLPPYDSRETLTRLLEVLAETGARQFLLLGDCFHDARGYARLGTAERDLFDRLLEYDPLWIVGNHDGDFVPPGFKAYYEYKRHDVTFRHEARPGATCEISGHFHPKANLVHKGARISRACFVEDGLKLMMPAFGAYAGGLSVNDPAIRDHFSGESRLHVLSRTKLFTFPLPSPVSAIPGQAGQ